jgi:hypothetical protein
MAHLQLISDNRAVTHPFRMRREREARRVELGMVGITGGRLLPMVITPPSPTFLGQAHPNDEPSYSGC